MERNSGGKESVGAPRMADGAPGEHWRSGNGMEVEGG